MLLELVQGPTEEEILALLPVKDLKAHERIFHSHEDDVLKDCILEAFATIHGRNGVLNRSILTSTWRAWYGSFCDKIELPLSPLIEVDAVNYMAYDSNGVPAEQELQASGFEAVAGGLIGYVRRPSGISWPHTARVDRAVSIEFTAGYGSAAQMDVVTRSDFRRCLKILAGHYFQNREATYAEPRLVMVNRKLEFGLDWFIARYRVPADHR